MEHKQLTIAYDPPADHDQGEDDVLDAQRPQLVCFAPGEDTPIVTGPKAFVVRVNIVFINRVGGFSFEEHFISEGCVFNYERVKDRAQNVGL